MLIAKSFAVPVEPVKKPTAVVTSDQPFFDPGESSRKMSVTQPTDVFSSASPGHIEIFKMCSDQVYRLLALLSPIALKLCENILICSFNLSMVFVFVSASFNGV